MTWCFPPYNLSNFEAKRSEKRIGVNTETQVELCRMGTPALNFTGDFRQGDKECVAWKKKFYSEVCVLVETDNCFWLNNGKSLFHDSRWWKCLCEAECVEIPLENETGWSESFLDGGFATIESSFQKGIWKVATCSDNSPEEEVVVICFEMWGEIRLWTSL